MNAACSVQDASSQQLQTFSVAPPLGKLSVQDRHPGAATSQQDTDPAGVIPKPSRVPSGASPKPSGGATEVDPKPSGGPSRVSPKPSRGPTGVSPQLSGGPSAEPQEWSTLLEQVSFSSTSTLDVYLLLPDTPNSSQRLVQNSRCNLYLCNGNGMGSGAYDRCSTISCMGLGM